METRQAQAQQAHGGSRRALLQAGLAAGVTLSAWPLWSPPALWGAEMGQPRRGGVLRARGRDPVHFDPHLTRNQRTHAVLSLVYSKLLQHKVGTDVQPGTFIAEPDLAEGWEAPHSIGFSGNQRASAGRGKLTLDFLYPSDNWLRTSSENLPNNINMIEVYHEIRGNLEFSCAITRPEDDLLAH